MKIEKWDQVGIVVRDFEKTAEYYRSFFNFNGAINIVEQDATVQYKGKEATFEMKKIPTIFLLSLNVLFQI